MDSDLSTWIAELRARLARGELGRLGPMDLGYGEFASGEEVIRIMLADLDDLEQRPTQLGEQPSLASRRRAIVEDFRRLRALIG